MNLLECGQCLDILTLTPVCHLYEYNRLQNYTRGQLSRDLQQKGNTMEKQPLDVETVPLKDMSHSDQGTKGTSNSDNEQKCTNFTSDTTAYVCSRSEESDSNIVNSNYDKNLDKMGHINHGQTFLDSGMGTITPKSTMYPADDQHIHKGFVSDSISTSVNKHQVMNSNDERYNDSVPINGNMKGHVGPLPASCIKIPINNGVTSSGKTCTSVTRSDLVNDGIGGNSITNNNNVALNGYVNTCFDDGCGISIINGIVAQSSRVDVGVEKHETFSNTDSKVNLSRGGAEQKDCRRERCRSERSRSMSEGSNYSGRRRRHSLAAWSGIGLPDSRSPSITVHSEVKTDRCIDWLVVLASFFIHVIVDGINFSFGVIYVALLNEFQESKSATSWVGSIQIAASWIMGPIASALSEKLGHRTVGIIGSVLAAVGFGVSSLVPNLALLYLTYGALTGVGFGLMYFPSIVAVQDHFEKRKSLAMGIAVCGSGVGTFSMAPLIELLILTITWRYTFLVLAGFSISGIAFSMLFLPVKLSENDAALDNDVENTKTCCSKTITFIKEQMGIPLLRDASLVIWLICMFFIQIGYVIPYAYIPDYAQEKGVDATRSAFLISILGITNTVARLVVGILADCGCVKRIYILAVSVMAAGVASGIMPVMAEYTVLATVCALYGLFLGTFVSVAPVVLRDIVGVEKLGPAFGLTMLSIGFGSLVISAGGTIHDLTGSYEIAFYITGGLLFAAGWTLISLSLVHKLQRRCCRHRSEPVTKETGE